MTDIILAGPAEERFGGLEKMLQERNESFDRVRMDLTDPRFQEPLADQIPALIVVRFHEGDLASIKAMQNFRLKHPCAQFIFLAEKEISSPILTLMFNEGAFGILKEPLSAESAVLLARQAIKKSKWDMEDMARSRELLAINSGLQKRVDQLEMARGGLSELIDKLERMLIKTLTDRRFKPARIKILLVSASEYQRNILSEDIRAAGFTVETRPGGAEALALALKIKPSIIVSDLELKDMSGLELASAIKGDASYPNVYFVVVTSSAEKIGDILAPGSKVDDCVLKPTSPADHYHLVARIALGALNT